MKGHIIMSCPKLLIGNKNSQYGCACGVILVSLFLHRLPNDHTHIFSAI